MLIFILLYDIIKEKRKILKRRLLDGICFEPLAEEFDLSEKQVRNILYKHMKKLDKILK